MAEISLQERLANPELLALPRLTWRDVLTLKADSAPLTETEQQSLDAYFRVFVDLPKNDKGEALCLGCGSSFGRDALSAFLLGSCSGRTTWEWSITHGECHCRECGWPARAYHYDVGQHDDGTPIFTRMNVTLAVHPAELRIEARQR